MNSNPTKKKDLDQDFSKFLIRYFSKDLRSDPNLQTRIAMDPSMIDRKILIN